MGNVYLLDCTLRDGGYINDWEFGYSGITQIIKKLEQTGIEMIEVGFLKGDTYDENKTLFPSIDSIKHVLLHKNPNVSYVCMLDMSSPVPLERIVPYDGTSVDGIRVIFKKNKTNEAYEACKYIKAAGYQFYVNYVSTDAYTDKEFIEGIEKFNELKPTGVTIVDTFGVIKRKQFQRLVAIADNNVLPDTKICYHAHNNLQQAFGNSEAMVDMNLSRDIVIDACVFGMGRGAGNLNLELFAEYMNDNYGKSYQISPMLEIMDEYLSEFYKTKFWGYSLPLYLSAMHKCHPNYAIYLAEKNTLTEKTFNELLKSISPEDKLEFSKDKLEYYYRKYMDALVDDREVIDELSKDFYNSKALLIAPGKSIKEYSEVINECISDSVRVVCVNFYDAKYKPDFVFLGNIRRYNKIDYRNKSKVICTSNITDSSNADYVVNFSSLTGSNSDIFDNSGLMALRLLEKLGVDEVFIAGFDGYSETESVDYYDNGFVSYPHHRISMKNDLIAEEINEIKKRIKLSFLTPTKYSV